MTRRAAAWLVLVLIVTCAAFFGAGYIIRGPGIGDCAGYSGDLL